VTRRRLPLSHLWSSEKGLSAMFVFLCLAIFVVAPLVAVGVLPPFLFDLFFSLLLLSGIIVVARRPLLTAVVSVLTVATLIARWVSFEVPQAPARLWSDAFAIVLLLILAALVLWQVFREGPITSHRIQGAIVAYMLIGVACAVAYEFVYQAFPGAFQIAHAEASRQKLSLGLLYYSFVTLTTVGYGDITPIHPFARSVAIAEALTGQLYPAILIAGLVSLRISHRQKP